MYIDRWKCKIYLSAISLLKSHLCLHYIIQSNLVFLSTYIASYILKHTGHHVIKLVRSNIHESWRHLDLFSDVLLSG